MLLAVGVKLITGIDCFEISSKPGLKAIRLASWNLLGAVVHAIYPPDVPRCQSHPLPHRLALGIEERRHGLPPVAREGRVAVMHHAADVIGNIKVSDFARRSQAEAVDTLGPNVLPINANVIVPVEGVLHVVETERVHELVNDCEEAKAAGLDGVRLEANALRPSPPTHNGCTAHRVAREENVVALGRPVRKLEAGLALEVSGGHVNVINLVLIWNVSRLLDSKGGSLRRLGMLTEQRLIDPIRHRVVSPTQ